MRLLTAALASLRPRQWVKNLFVFAGAHLLAEPVHPARVAGAGARSLIFCALSGAIYLLNDVADAEKDRLHPGKRYRPIASGRPAGAGRPWRSASSLLVGSLVAAFCLSCGFGLVAAAYAALLTAYSVWLKHLVILDVLTVAIGLRAPRGGGRRGHRVEISGWLLICTILVALFLALGKRRHEYLTLKGDAAAHRPILAEYSEGFLDQMIAVVTASTVTAYALYTMSPETVAKFHTRLLPVTLPFVLYGDLPVPLPALPPRAGRQPVRPPAQRPRAPRQHRPLDAGAPRASSTARSGGHVARALDAVRAGSPLEARRGLGPPSGAARAGGPLRASSALPAGGAPVHRARARPRLRRRRDARGAGRDSWSRRTRADRILGFDADSGRLTCEAGLSLAEILRVFAAARLVPAGHPRHQVRHGRRRAWPATSTARTTTATAPSASSWTASC